MTTVPTGTVVEKAVLLAGRAPSLHNSQPWRWIFDGVALHLLAVPGRMLPATDSSGRQMIISCGIALGHLNAAMAAAGLRPSIARFPNPNRRDHLATVRFHSARVVSDADRDRADAIVRRRTDRRPFAAPADWDSFETVLRSTFSPDDATVDVLSDDCRPALAHAAELSAALRRYDSSYQAELQWWTGHVVASTGVPRQALVTQQERSRVPIGRRLPTGDAAAAADFGTDKSTVLVLSTDTDAPGDLLRCGEVLSTVLLECTLAGYATCPLTHLTEIPRSRSIVRDLTGRNLMPQVLVRVGTGPESATEPTPRLPLSDILEMGTP
ncbi:Acg family FMN-binding oxidoreductase [Nocardia wallacei]|uniref:Acg family FMN-binding oxidoreductase n=1 Tax=Nocardia wallacei TaxID=480035 RepID=UPI002453D90E|nr:NAD(P)H nitroreductase [Nocardia wallacei]